MKFTFHPFFSLSGKGTVRQKSWWPTKHRRRIKDRSNAIVDVDKRGKAKSKASKSAQSGEYQRIVEWRIKTNRNRNRGEIYFFLLVSVELAQIKSHAVRMDTFSGRAAEGWVGNSRKLLVPLYKSLLMRTPTSHADQEKQLAMCLRPRSRFLTSWVSKSASPLPCRFNDPARRISHVSPLRDPLFFRASKANKQTQGKQQQQAKPHPIHQCLLR